MSQVTNVILSMGTNTDQEAKDYIAQVNHFFSSENTPNKQGFAYINDWQYSQPGWLLEVDLAIGAFNYLNLDALVKHLRTIDWGDKASIQLLVREQNEWQFRIIDVFPDRVSI